MIERISVRDFILVDSLELEFSPGFNVLSGETGAGKSILVGALSVLFGGKGGADLVRSGAEEAMVAGEFCVESHQECLSWLMEREIEPDEGVIMVRRTLKTSGRGTIYMQSTPVTRSDLEQFAGFLLDLHSQHEHQSLFHETTHRRLLDRYAGIESDVVAFGELFARLSHLQTKLQELVARDKDRDREIEMLEFAISEINDAGIRPGEWNELDAERSRLVQHEKLAEHVENLARLLEDDGGETASLATGMKTARLEAAAVARIDPELQGEADRMESLYYELEDIGQTILAYRDQLLYDPARLDGIEERLSALRELFRKYGGTEEEIIGYAERSEEELNALRTAEESREGLRREIQELEQTIRKDAGRIHAARVAAAGTLQSEIIQVLRDLAMSQAHFSVTVETRTGEAGRLVCGPFGADRVRYLISTNPGESVRPLSQVASGGEMSRVMLAIKTVLAESDEVRSLVFDEIDTGIGGQVALALASHLSNLALHTQVICITHLATIAVRADNHIAVEKMTINSRAVISARTLTDEGRVGEIARMLSGEDEETYSLDHARALLERNRREMNGKDK
jgi:DNA repair protein RecN (Recombination protein N)